MTLHLDTVSASQDAGKIMDKRITNILSDYSNVFQGLGKLKDYKVQLKIDESIEPVASKPRRIPFHIRKNVDAAIDSLIAGDIIEKTPDTQPTPWVSPIVVVGQKNDNVRLCIDMRKPNSTLKRTRTPFQQSIDVLLNGSAYFSKLDVRQAFHHLELHEESRYTTTFCTHRGLFING